MRKLLSVGNVLMDDGFGLSAGYGKIAGNLISKRVMKQVYFLFFFFLACTTVPAQTFTLKSNELGGQAGNQQVLNGFGCNGDNISPQLSWSNAPKAAKSFAVTLYDENAPTGSGWWHWLIFDINASVSELPSNAGKAGNGIAPAGSVQSLSDFRTAGYGGPCPPPGSGLHRYVITLYALKTEKLGLDSTANPALVGFMLEKNVIGKASLIFYYSR